MSGAHSWSEPARATRCSSWKSSGCSLPKTTIISCSIGDRARDPKSLWPRRRSARRARCASSRHLGSARPAAARRRRGVEEGRFRAGALFANRFRIVARARPRRHGRGVPRPRPRARPAGRAEVPDGAVGRTSARARGSATRCVSRGSSRIPTSAASTTSARRTASCICRWSTWTARTWPRC